MTAARSASPASNYRKSSLRLANTTRSEHAGPPLIGMMQALPERHGDRQKRRCWRGRRDARHPARAIWALLRTSPALGEAASHQECAHYKGAECALSIPKILMNGFILYLWLTPLGRFWDKAQASTAATTTPLSQPAAIAEDKRELRAGDNFVTASLAPTAPATDRPGPATRVSKASCSNSAMYAGGPFLDQFCTVRLETPNASPNPISVRPSSRLAARNASASM